MMKCLKLCAALVVAALSACGGEAEAPQLDAATKRTLTASFVGSAACMPAAEYRARLVQGGLRPLPASLPAGAIWTPPFLLLPAPAGGVQPMEYAPGLVGTPVTVQGPVGLMTVHGPYYVAGELPEWVCA